MIPGATALVLLVAGVTVGVGHATDAPVVARLARQVRALQLAKVQWDAAQRKVSSSLHALVWPSGPSPMAGRAAPVASWRLGSTLHVYIALASTEPEVLQRLEEMGVTIETLSAGLDTMQVWMDESDLAGVAALPFVRAIRPVYPPRHRVGEVTTRGDRASRADLVRPQGYDGSGVVVGVISDGIDSLAASQSTGDLASVAVPLDGRCDPGFGDEGTAMLEIVHDLAPGAVKLFSGGFDGRFAFINSVRCLTAAGAQVIVDDLGFYDEPYFEDGPIADAVRTAVEAGISYHSAAGNDAQRAYLDDLRPDVDGFHDFDPGEAVDLINGFQVGARQSVSCFLQWNDPFGRSSNDYDLFLVDPAMGSVLASSQDGQSGTQDPLEIVDFTNPSSSLRQVGLQVQRLSGENRVIRVVCPDSVALEHGTPSKVIFGHPAVPEVVALGALDVGDPGLDDLEPFSSGGPALIYFPSFERRPKPDLAAFDGVATTAPGFGVFFGTSAAAPHSAAVAALLLSKNPFLPPGEVQTILKNTAVDIGPPGPDDFAGFGRLDALAAIDATPPSTSTTTTTIPCLTDCADDDPCTDDLCQGGTCVHPPASCDDGFACTREQCDPRRGCVAEAPAGVVGVSCLVAVALGDPACAEGIVPGRIRRRITSGVSSVDLALSLGPRGQTRALTSARRHFQRAKRNVKQAVRRQRLSPTCGTTLTTTLRASRQRLRVAGAF